MAWVHVWYHRILLPSSIVAAEAICDSTVLGTARCQIAPWRHGYQPRCGKIESESEGHLGEQDLEVQRPMAAQQTIAITRARDIVTARNAGREMARTLGFNTLDQTRLATAISELTRNVCQYAGSGVCVLTDASDQDRVRLCVVVEDQGSRHRGSRRGADGRL